MTRAPCARCGGLTYLENDDQGGPAIACLSCGQRTWTAAPAPWTPRQGLPRPPVWQGAADDD